VSLKFVCIMCTADSDTFAATRTRRQAQADSANLKVIDGNCCLGGAPKQDAACTAPGLIF
jgi:hypothetical protein